MRPSGFLARASILTAVNLLSCFADTVAASASGNEPGIALAIVLDSSGSMNEFIPTTGGSKDTKHRIAQRAFSSVIKRLETFATRPAAPPLAVGTYVFHGNAAIAAHRLAPFDAAALRHWIAQVKPGGPTPLGEALALAGGDLLAFRASTRHLLVLTDGANTAGRAPDVVLEKLQSDGSRAQTPVFVYVIALDLDPRTFARLEKLGATLIGAANEGQLNAHFDFILEGKILVEAP
jgi:hypothetical protein